VLQTLLIKALLSKQLNWCLYSWLHGRESWHALVAYPFTCHDDESADCALERTMLVAASCRVVWPFRVSASRSSSVREKQLRLSDKGKAECGWARIFTSGTDTISLLILFSLLIFLFVAGAAYTIGFSTGNKLRLADRLARCVDNSTGVNSAMPLWTSTSRSFPSNSTAFFLVISSAVRELSSNCASLHADPASSSLGLYKFYKLSRSFFQNIYKPASSLHHLLPPPRNTSAISRLRSSTSLPQPTSRTKKFESFANFALNRY